MAISRINGKQIRPGVLTNTHVAADAAIEETKLSINWSGHYASALESKKVVDYVQVVNKTVAGTEFNLTLDGALQGNAPISTSAGTAEGVITDAPYNKVVIRDVITGEPILDLLDQEVFGRLVHDGVDFKLLFLTLDEAQLEVAFDMPANTAIDFQYMERFNLRTISELFAANEKFVAGSADVTSVLNIEQLAKDLYGAGYSLDRDGDGNLVLSIVEQLAAEVQDRQDADQAILDDLAAQSTALKGANLVGVEDAGSRFLGNTVEAVLAEIKDALDGLEADLASTELDKGASLVGVHDAEGKFTGTTVEAVLAELDTKINTTANGGNSTQTEVDAARKATALTGVEVTHASLDERLEATDTVVKATQDEVEAARGTEASLDTRLDRALNENGTLKAGAQIHSHHRARYQAAGGEAEVLLTAFNKANLPAFQVGDDSLEVFINGQLQEPGLNYQEGALGEKIVFDLGDGTVLEPTDIIQIKYFINNAE
jgi:hypothetical protein